MPKINYSFWQLLTEHPIKIPIIQRDFAQGRSTEPINQIRTNLLDSLYASVVSDQPVIFDFVYGSIEDEDFVPLDGQQRLTTLFLLHWYLAAKDGILNEAEKKIMYKFTYETRPSSRDFLHSLVKESFHLAFLKAPKLPDCKRLSSAIKDAPWFFAVWKNDPSVQAMLVMLDAIDNKFGDVTDGFLRLTNEPLYDGGLPPVSFQLLRLEDFGLTDSLYIKMNARGKALTSFENFKAQLEVYLSEHYPEEKEIVATSIDGKWTDLFWNYKDGDDLFDDAFMNFFRSVAVNNYAIKETGKEREQVITNSFVNKDAVLYFPFYEKQNCFDKEGIKMIIDTANCLVNGHGPVKQYLPDNKLVDEGELFKQLAQGELTYGGRIQFYALTQFVIFHKTWADQEIKDWIRVIRNLTKNAPYNGADEFIRDIRSVRDMLAMGKQILGFIGNARQEITGFTRVQRDEERLKAMLILKSNEWRTRIEDVENHDYFQGQIGFLLNFCGVSQYYETHVDIDWTEAEDNTFLDKFDFYVLRAINIFNKDGLKSFDNFLWERALFTKGNFTYNGNMLVAGDREASWSRLLRDNTDRRQFVKLVLDEINDHSAMEQGLADIVTRALKNNSLAAWQLHLVRNPALLAKSGNRQLLWEQDGRDLLVLEKRQTNGWHREVYSYSLCLLLRSRGEDVQYVRGAKRDEEKYINKISGKHVYIAFKLTNGEWRYEFKINGTDTPVYYDSEQEVLDALVASDYLTNSSIQ